MHYHVIVTTGDIEPGSRDASPMQEIETFETWREAEARARTISSGADDWSPTRYPGRTWKRGEVVAYLDRRVFSRPDVRREVSIVRCPGLGQPDCDAFTSVAPALTSPFPAPARAT